MNTIPVTRVWIAIACVMALAVARAQKEAASLRESDAAAALTEPAVDGRVELNLKDVPVDAVLDHLSDAAGLAVVKDVTIEGAISLISHQPLTTEDAVELLNVALREKGYAAIKTGRILRIVSRDTAKTYDLPVIRGADPEEMPKSDELVTQIMPVRYADAAKLLENLQPLLGPSTTISANQSSNAVLITDTRTNVRRMASIIQALDTSIAAISEIRVYALQYADAEELAKAVTSLFEQPGAAANGRDPRDRMRRMFMRMRGMEEQEEDSSDSEAKQAASRIKAVADERSNSLIVAAPAEVLDTVTSLVEQLDVTVGAVSEVRVFPLQHADAEELADVINGIFEDPAATAAASRTSMRRMFMRRGPGAESADQSSEQDADTRVKAVGDSRSNCVVVTAPPDVLATIAELVKQIDVPSEDASVLKVFPLRYADAETIADNLNSLFQDEDNDNTVRSAAGRAADSRARGGRTGRTNQQSQTASRQLQEADLVAVADTRTNAVIVSASEATLAMVADVVRQLDESPKNVAQVYVYKIRHADLEKIRTILEGMFEDLEEQSTTGTTGRTGTATVNLRRSN